MDVGKALKLQELDMEEVSERLNMNEVGDAVLIAIGSDAATAESVGEYDDGFEVAFCDACVVWVSICIADPLDSAGHW